MSTMTWLVRWLIGGWASCFFASKLPLDDHKLASSPITAVQNMAFDKKKDKSFNCVNSKKLSRSKSPMVKDKDGVPIGNRFDYSSWSLSADEDYIVFCFGEDGTFDVVKDDKGVMSETLIRGIDGMHKNPRSLNCKLKYGEDAEQVSDLNIREKRSNANQHDQDCITPDEEDDEKEMVHTGRQKHRENIRRVCQVEGIEDYGMLSAESSDSDLSEGSTGSFAFPVLGWEWIGSPVRMPNSESLHLKKLKARCMRFQCCRF